MRNKSFDFHKGVYYFNIKNGYNNNITIKRKEKKMALHAFSMYLATHPGKCEWLGKWDGKKFQETDFQNLKTGAAAAK